MEKKKFLSDVAWNYWRWIWICQWCFSKAKVRQGPKLGRASLRKKAKCIVTLENWVYVHQSYGTSSSASNRRERGRANTYFHWTKKPLLFWAVNSAREERQARLVKLLLRINATHFRCHRQRSFVALRRSACKLAHIFLSLQEIHNKRKKIFFVRTRKTER